MNRRLSLLLITAIIAPVGISGCKHRCCKDTYVASAPPPCCGPAPAVAMRPFHALSPQRYDNVGGPVVPPNQAVIVPGPGAPGLPPAAPPVTAPPAAPPPSVPPPDVRNYAPPSVPPPEPVWRPTPDSQQQQPPTNPNQDKGPAKLYPPESTEPPQPPAPAKPNAPAEKPPSPQLPVGIPQFQMARERVASGLRPSLEGLDWLQNSGYRTILHLRKPNEQENADRKVIERKGIKYVSLEVSPQTLNQELLAEFNRLIADSASQPVFVYDLDGSLQGGLWYLHYRKVELASDDEARVRAGRLGLKEAQTEEQKEMWLAIQKLLSGQ